jgi:hypothetical protein
MRFLVVHLEAFQTYNFGHDRYGTQRPRMLISWLNSDEKNSTGWLAKAFHHR